MTDSINRNVQQFEISKKSGKLSSRWNLGVVITSLFWGMVKERVVCDANESNLECTQLRLLSAHTTKSILIPSKKKRVTIQWRNSWCAVRTNVLFPTSLQSKTFVLVQLSFPDIFFSQSIFSFPTLSGNWIQLVGPLGKRREKHREWIKHFQEN